MRTLPTTLLLLLVTLFATACASTSGPDRDDLAAVNDGESAIVMLRVITTSNAGPVPPFDSALEIQCVSVGMSEPGGGPVSQIDDLESFSDEALAAGWIYVMLPAGKHRVAFNPPSMWDMQSGADRWHDTAHWSFVVPPDTPVVYIGTMQLHCRAEASDFGGIRIRTIRAEKLHDESVAATAIAARFLPDQPAPVTVLPERDHGRESVILGATNEAP